MTNPVADHTLSLLWSLWTELGVPGVERRHPHVAVDPEPLIVATPWLAQADARLQEEALRWCAAHADRISASRLLALADRAAPQVHQAFDEFASTLAAQTRVRWSDVTPKSVTRTVMAKLPPTLPATRPALVRFRLRALAGVGARADVLAELLASAGGWVTASDLSHLGYSKRNVARVLTELADGGVARSRRERNALAFQLANQQTWQTLLGDTGLVWPHWDAVFSLTIAVAELAAQTGTPDPVKRVAAASAQVRLGELTDVLSMPSPPQVRGEGAAFAMMTAWCEGVLADLAAGEMPERGQNGDSARNHLKLQATQKSV